MPVAGFPNPAAVLVTQALDAAVARVGQTMMAGMPPPGPASNIFVPLGEALMWVCSLDEMLSSAGGIGYTQTRDADPDGCVIRGLRYARNQQVHGVVVATVFHGGAVPGLMVPGRAAPGQPPTYRWISRNQLPPPGKPQGQLEPAYDQHLDGREVLVTLNAALGYARGEAGT